MINYCHNMGYKIHTSGTFPYKHLKIPFRMTGSKWKKQLFSSLLSRVSLKHFIINLIIDLLQIMKLFSADSDDETDVPDKTPRTKKRKRNEELDFSGSLGQFHFDFLIFSRLVSSLHSFWNAAPPLRFQTGEEEEERTERHTHVRFCWRGGNIQFIF